MIKIFPKQRTLWKEPWKNLTQDELWEIHITRYKQKPFRKRKYLKDTYQDPIIYDFPIGDNEVIPVITYQHNGNPYKVKQVVELSNHSLFELGSKWEAGSEHLYRLIDYASSNKYPSDMSASEKILIYIIREKLIRSKNITNLKKLNTESNRLYRDLRKRGHEEQTISRFKKRLKTLDPLIMTLITHLNKGLLHD